MKEDLKIVCIFNKDRLRNAIGGDTYNIPFCTNEILRTTKYLFFSKSQVSNSEFSNWDIVLNIDDNVNFDDTQVFKKKYALVMYHQTPTNSANELNGKAFKFKRGYHDNLPIHGYTLLKYLIQAWDGNLGKFKQPDYEQAKEKLIKWFNLNEKLNIALKFLHESLGGKSENINILTKGEEKFDLTKDIYKGKSLQEWIDKLNGKTGDEYNTVLADVRDALLWHAGVTGENKVLC